MIIVDKRNLTPILQTQKHIKNTWDIASLLFPWRRESSKPIKVLPYVFMLICLLATSGCSIKRQPIDTVPPTGSLEQHIQSLQSINKWTIEGRVGFRSEQTSGSASLTWSHSPDDDQLDLFGPLGSGHVSLTSNNRQAVLQISANDRFEAPSAEQLLQRHLGWHLPVSRLNDWVKGSYYPEHARVTTVNPDGTLATLQQDGWLVTYTQYQQINGLAMPKRLSLKNGRMRLKLSIQAWKIAK